MNDVPHMSGDEFRARGYEMVDYIARYLEEVEKYPVLSPVQPGEISNALPHTAPRQGESWDDIIADVQRIVMPGITHWQSPDFFAYFSANVSAPSILGELLSAGLGVQGMLWTTSPACTELETRVLDWLVEMLDLPRHFLSPGINIAKDESNAATERSGGGVIQDTASSATLTSLLTARDRITGWSASAKGITQRLTAYTSTQAHSSLEKAAMIAGIGRENVRFIDVDENFALRPQSLEEAIARDRREGALPCFICATLGTTSSHAMDPLRLIGEIAEKEGIFLHVDAAEAGSALVCPEFRFFADGLEYADSFCFNPHKHLLTNFDCDCYFVKERADLIRTMSVMPEYLKNRQTMSGEVFDYRDWHIPLGRRFRSLKLWFVIRHYGVEGLRAYIREHVRLTQLFASLVMQDGRFEICAPHPLNLVCFRLKSEDEVNQRLVETLNDSGDLFVTHTRLNDRYVIRFAVGSTLTEEKHIRQAWQRICTCADSLT